MSKPIKLNDYTLLKFLIDNYHDFSFFSQDQTIDHYVKDIKDIFTKTKKRDLERDGFKIIFNPSQKKAVDVLDFWERLIIDALKYLKWHDLDEFVFKNGEKRNPTNYKKKKEAFDKISEGSLGVYNLKEYFKAFIEFERLLYGAEQFYRDHVYHILKVWLIGQFIIKNHINDNFLISINEDKENLAFTKLAKSEKNKGTLYAGEEDAMWCLIALTHDLGYPLSKVESINKSLKKMIEYYAKTGLEEFSFSFPQQNVFINDAILKYISSKIVRAETKEKAEFDTHIQAKFYLKYSRSFELFKHGLISCIVLVKNLIYFLETNFDHNPSTNLGDEEEARQFVIRREILRAIASHTCPEIYHIKPNTFSFILLLADEMQSWGRPTFEDMALGAYKQYSMTMNDFSDKLISFTITCKKDPDQKPDSLIGFFMEKAAFFKKLLRVAVDTSQRQFTLEFEIIDDGLGEKFKFVAEPKKRAIMTINGNTINHKELEKLAVLHKKNIFKLKTDVDRFIEDYGFKKI